MRPLSEILVDLIGFAEEVITRPAMHHYGFAIDTRFAALAAEVRHADARPAEGVRTTRAAVVMVTVLEQFFDGRGVAHGVIVGDGRYSAVTLTTRATSEVVTSVSPVGVDSTHVLAASTVKILAT